MISPMPDFLHEVIERRSKRNPRFAEMVDEAFRGRELIRRLVEKRQARGLTQTEVAALMGTSQSAVARFERAEVDPRTSTLARYAAAVGVCIEWEVSAVGGAS